MPQDTPVIALRPTQAAKALGVHRSTLYRLEKKGKIKMDRPTDGITLITMEEVKRFVKQRDDSTGSPPVTACDARSKGSGETM